MQGNESLKAKLNSKGRELKMGLIRGGEGRTSHSGRKKKGVQGSVTNREKRSLGMGCPEKGPIKKICPDLEADGGCSEAKR